MNNNINYLAFNIRKNIKYWFQCINLCSMCIILIGSKPRISKKNKKNFLFAWRNWRMHIYLVIFINKIHFIKIQKTIKHIIKKKKIFLHDLVNYPTSSIEIIFYPIKIYLRKNDMASFRTYGMLFWDYLISRVS
jgi:hypothetical protein